MSTFKICSFTPDYLLQTLLYTTDTLPLTIFNPLSTSPERLLSFLTSQKMHLPLHLALFFLTAALASPFPGLVPGEIDVRDPPLLPAGNPPPGSPLPAADALPLDGPEVSIGAWQQEAPPELDGGIGGHLAQPSEYGRDGGQWVLDF